MAATIARPSPTSPTRRAMRWKYVYCGPPVYIASVVWPWFRQVTKRMTPLSRARANLVDHGGTAEKVIRPARELRRGQQARERPLGDVRNASTTAREPVHGGREHGPDRSLV